MTQLSFDLPARTALSREDFLVSPSNAVALAMIDRPDTWQSGKLVLTGPEGSGKTHLAHVWAAGSGARIIAATDLAQADAQALCQAPLVVEDVPLVANDRAAQEALFHLHNMLLARNRPLVMTGRGTPAHWGLSLPDLQSRVDAALHAALSAPDDTLLGALIAKLFHDRQLAPPPNVIAYLVPRIDRSSAAAADIVARIDKAALSGHRPITRRLAAEVLGAGDTAA